MKDGNRWLRNRRKLFVSLGILKHGDDKIVCPAHMRSQIIQHYHDSPFSGHIGFETTLNGIRNRYFWNYMPSQIQTYCQSCNACQIFNYACLHNLAPLKSFSLKTMAVGVDIMGPLKTSIHGNKYVILAIDHFTKSAEGAARASFNAVTTAVFLFNNIICHYDMIEKLLSDQGVNFESNLIKHLCILLGTEELHTSTYHASGNGN